MQDLTRRSFLQAVAGAGMAMAIPVSLAAQDSPEPAKMAVMKMAVIRTSELDLISVGRSTVGRGPGLKYTFKVRIQVGNNFYDELWAEFSGKRILNPIRIQSHGPPFQWMDLISSARLHEISRAEDLIKFREQHSAIVWTGFSYSRLYSGIGKCETSLGTISFDEVFDGVFETCFLPDIG